MDFLLLYLRPALEYNQNELYGNKHLNCKQKILHPKFYYHLQVPHRQKPHQSPFHQDHAQPYMKRYVHDDVEFESLVILSRLHILLIDNQGVYRMQSVLVLS